MHPRVSPGRGGDVHIIDRRSSTPETQPVYSKYSDLLSPGWIPGRLVVSGKHMRTAYNRGAGFD